MNRKNVLSLLVIAGVVAVALVIPYLLTNQIPSFAHLWKLGIVGSVVKYLLSFVGVWLTYHFSKFWITDGRVEDNLLSELKQYLLCIGVCGLIASCSGYYLGTHKENDDYLGGGDRVVDYEPTGDERIRHGLVFFFCLCTPALFGMHEALTELRYKRRQKSSTGEHI